jgi:phage terminase large subunit-like protein
MDAAVSGDCFALVMVSGDGNGLLEVRYSRKWTPPLGGKLDFSEPEKEIRRLIDEYNVIEIAYDPYQLEDMAGRLNNELIAHMFAFNQGKDRLVADKSLRDIIQGRRIAHSGEVDLKEHVQNANAEISSGEKGLRIVKKSDSKKIDLVVALSMAVSRAVYWSL